MNKNLTIGVNENYWSWNDDTSIIVAKLIFNLNENKLYLDLTKIHKKRGLGKGEYIIHLGKFEVGSMNKPKKSLINSYLKEYKQMEPFPRKGWKIDGVDKLNLSELFEQVCKGGSTTARLLKIQEIRLKMSK